MTNEIQPLVQTINDSWLHGPPEAIPDVLNRCFHDDVVILGPGLQEIAKGREACVASYQSFVNQATVKSFSVTNMEIDAYGDTASVRYSWEMEYELKNEMHHETGRELFVFASSGTRWLAVLRACTSTPK
jgi:ketosteroid isomerase-like protein